MSSSFIKPPYGPEEPSQEVESGSGSEMLGSYVFTFRGLAGHEGLMCRLR